MLYMYVSEDIPIIILNTWPFKTFGAIMIVISDKYLKGKLNSHEYHFYV